MGWNTDGNILMPFALPDRETWNDRCSAVPHTSCGTFRNNPSKIDLPESQAAGAFVAIAMVVNIK
jgi:hypothetical protein